MEYGKKFNELMSQQNLKSISFLETLPTPRLLEYYKKHRVLSYVGLCGCGWGEPMSAVVDVDDKTKQYFDDCLSYINAIKSSSKR